MASQLYVPGPSHMAVGSGTAYAMEYLGLGDDQGCRIVLNGRFEDVLTDLSGPMVPFDVQWFAEDIFVSVTLTKVEATVLAKLQARIFEQTGGSIASADVGTLMRLEGKSMPLMIQFPYETKSVFTGQMIAGFRFPIAWPADAIERHASTRVERVRVTFRAIPDWNTDGSGLLYDHDMTNFPSFT